MTEIRAGPRAEVLFLTHKIRRKGEKIMKIIDSYNAIDNEGVASHPSNKGMTEIANRIIEKLLEQYQSFLQMIGFQQNNVTCITTWCLLYS